MVCNASHGCKCPACGRRGAKQATAWALREMAKWTKEKRHIGRFGREAQELAAKFMERQPHQPKKRKLQQVEDQRIERTEKRGERRDVDAVDAVHESPESPDLAMALPATPLMDTEPVRSVERPKAAPREPQAVHLEKAEVDMEYETGLKGLAKVLPCIDAQWSPKAFAMLATLSRSFLNVFALEVIKENHYKVLQVRLACLEQDVPMPGGAAQRLMEATLRLWSHFSKNRRFCSSFAGATNFDDFEEVVVNLDHRMQRLRALLEGS